MTDETSEAIVGDAIAASLERPEGGRRGLFGRKKTAENKPSFTHCEDCDAELHGHYCSTCGQVAVDYRRSFRHVIADVAESFLNWDSKFVKTIGLLVVRPGWLTNQFVAGRRTRYLHPLRLYLLVSIVFFLCARFVSFSPVSARKGEMPPEARAKMEEAMKNIQDLPPGVREQVQKALAEAAKTPVPAATSPAQSRLSASPPKTPAEEKSSEILQFDDDKKPKGPFETWLQRRVKDRVGGDGTKKQLFIETLRSNISTMMLFCIPLFAFVLKILYLRQRRFYIEHLVYALHIHAFFYIAVLLTSFSAVAASRWAPPLEKPLIWMLSIFVVVQVFLSIRQVYRQGWFMSIFKFFFGGFIYLFVIILAFVVTAFATVAFP